MIPRRKDGRAGNQIRPLAAEFGVLHAADGSARLSLGDTRVLVAVYGPRPARSVRVEDPHRSILEVTVLPATGQGGKPEADVELALHSVFAPAIVSEAHPRTVVSVHAQVIHDDGSLLPALINCATLALLDAGVPLHGMVTAVSCGLGVPGAGEPGAPAAAAGEGLAFDLLAGEEAACRVGGAYAFLGAPGPAGPCFTRQAGRASWADTQALLEGGALAAGTVLAFLRLAAQRKVERDAVNFGAHGIER